MGGCSLDKIYKTLLFDFVPISPLDGLVYDIYQDEIN